MIADNHSDSPTSVGEMSTTNAIQRQAKALGDPTRYRVFRLIVDSSRPLAVTDFTEVLPVTHNAIRKHLAQLVEADLIDETPGRPDGRGRPPLLYAVAPTAESRWGTVGPYERLATWLAEVVRSGDDPIEVGRRIGGREQVLAVGDTPVERLASEMQRQGFAAVMTEAPEGEHTVDIALRHCPFEAAAAADQATVCGLHRGIIEGTAQAIGAVVVDELIVGHPANHDCHIHCHHDVGNAEPT